VKLKASCGEKKEALVILKCKCISILTNIQQCMLERLLSFIHTDIGSELLITQKERRVVVSETGFMKVAAQFSVASEIEYTKTRKSTENVPNVFRSTASTQRIVTQTTTQVSLQKR